MPSGAGWGGRGDWWQQARDPLQQHCDSSKRRSRGWGAVGSPKAGSGVVASLKPPKWHLSPSWGPLCVWLPWGRRGGQGGLFPGNYPSSFPARLMEGARGDTA